MTIKTRNRLTLSFLIFSSIIFFGELGILLFQLFTGRFQLPELVSVAQKKSTFLFNYNSIYVILGIFMQNIYVFFATLFILRAFEKTQTTEIFYFSIFLLACLCDSARILIPLFCISNTFSRFLLVIANITLFARILVPISLMSTVLMNEDDERKNVERNTFIIIIAAAFLAEMIPLNTTTINSNLLVSYGYAKTINIATIVIHAANIFTLLIQNKIRESNQITTLGYILLMTGNYFMFNCINLFSLVIGFTLLGSGTFIYLKALHKFFLWND